MNKISKNTIEKELRELLDGLGFGNTKEFKKTKQKIERVWYKDRELFRECAPIAFEYMARFDEMPSDKHRAALVSGFHLFFLCMAHDHIDKLSEFVLQHIQHPSGSVREAVRKTAARLHIAFVDFSNPIFSGEMTDKQEKASKMARERHREYVKKIEKLIAQYYTDEYDKEKYVQDLKPSVYKSLQLLWVDTTRGGIRGVESESAREKRLEIEETLADFLQQYSPAGGHLTVGTIKDRIWAENGDPMESNREIRDIFTQYFEQSGVDLEDILQMFTEAWNAFPHESLDGKSPNQMLEEYRKEE